MKKPLTHEMCLRRSLRERENYDLLWQKAYAAFLEKQTEQTRQAIVHIIDRLNIIDYELLNLESKKKERLLISHETSESKKIGERVVEEVLERINSMKRKGLWKEIDTKNAKAT